MGGGSDSNNSAYNNNFSTKTLNTTTTQNPYVTSITNGNGTTTNLNGGLAKVDDYMNKNINQYLYDYFNPSLDTATNQAKINMYNKAMNENTYRNLENDIIQPLQKRNLIRSSVANDMYNNLAKNNADSYSDFINGLIANTQNEQGNALNNLFNWYLQGANIAQGNQAQSLNTSSLTGTNQTQGYSTGSSSSSSYGM